MKKSPFQITAYLSLLSSLFLSITLASCLQLGKERGSEDSRDTDKDSKSTYQKRIPNGTNFQGVQVCPPNWWIGMADPHLEIMLYDEGIKGSQVVLNYPGVRLLEVIEVENPNYLFIRLHIEASAIPGIIALELTQNETLKTFDFPLYSRPDHHPLSKEGLHPNDVIYLIMPDRFANGDPYNDSVEGMTQTGIDRQKMYHRHGGDLQGIMNHLDYLEELGVTAIWINPVQENDQPYDSYHGYAITDHYKIDRRLGSNNLYQELVKSCQERGIKVVMDIIHNHVGDEHFTIKDIPTSDWIHQHDTFWRTTYRDQTLMDPYASEYDKLQMTDGWFDNHMPDLDQTNPRVAQFLTQSNIWWVEYSGINAYRIDTYAYPDGKYMAQWGKAMQSEYPHLTMFAETWVHGSPNQAYFTQNNHMRNSFNTYMPAVTDFQLYYAINESLMKPQGWTEGVARLYTTLSHDFLYENPYRNVTFLDNHDLDRFLSVVGEDISKFKLGLNWLFTLRGIPMLYYGTEILMKNFANPDGLVRQDFQGGWQEDKVSKFEATGRSKEEQEAFLYIAQLINMRKKIPALGNGKMTQYVPKNGVYTYFRYDDKDTIMVVANTGSKESKIPIGTMEQFIFKKHKGLDLQSGQVTENINQIILKPLEGKILKISNGAFE